MTQLLLILSALMALAAPPATYAEGQVWQYKARTQDNGSLVKIQKIEKLAGETVYHVSISRLHLGPENVTDLQHAPVSLQTLDASVTRQVADPGTFPDPSEGIAEWRQANGGVFTISLGEIVELLQQSVPQGTPPPTTS